MIEGTGKHVPADLYWQWRTTIEEVKYQHSLVKIAKSEVREKTLETRIKELEAKLSTQRVKDARYLLESAEVEYNRIKGVIEKQLELSLNDSVIDEYNYEVKKINDDQSSSSKPVKDGD